MHSHRFFRVLACAFWLGLVTEPLAANKKKNQIPGFWVRDNLARGVALARETGKPLLIVFRCPP